MVRIIVTVVLVVLLTVLVAMNMSSRSDFNLYGIQFKDVPVIVVAALSFALGIVFSLFLYFLRFLRRRAKNSMDMRRKGLSEREKQLAGRESAHPGAAPTAGPGDTPADTDQRAAWRLFGRRKR